MDTPSSPAQAQAWRALVDSIKGGEPALGERLYLLGAGPVPVSGAAGGALTLTGEGGVLLVIGLAEASASAGAEVARQLEGIERLPGSKLREAGVDAGAGGGLRQRHAAFFDLEAPVDDLNTSQRCVVVLTGEAGGEGVESLRGELGDRLQGIFTTTAAGVTPLDAPVDDGAAAGAEIALDPEPEPQVDAAVAETEAEAAETEAEAAETEAEAAETEAEAEETEAEGPAEIEVALDDAPPPAETEGDAESSGVLETATGQPADALDAYLADETSTVITEDAEPTERTGRFASWPIGNWIGLAMVLLGIVLAFIGFKSLSDQGAGETDPGPVGEPNPLIRTVATGVPPDATHGRWIGQQRVVTLSDGTLAFVYPTPESLNIVKDEANGGETWGEPFALTEVQPVTLSVDVDSKDRLHVAYSDGASVNYVRLKNKPAGWKPSRLIQLDDNTTSPNVDVAWDEENQTAHVVWVQQSDDGEAPAWAALQNEGGIHTPEEGIMAQAGTDVPVLTNVAADGRGSVLITFRAGDQTTGWASRYFAGIDADGDWLFEEEEAIPMASFVGASDVVYDRRKTAHLVLRDSTNFALSYFTKKENGAWSQGEIAHESTKVSAVEFPALSTSAADGYVYLFFQTDEYYDPGEIAYLVRTDDGWSEPLDVVSDVDAPEGAQYPVAPDRIDQQALVFWTKTGETYEVATTPVSAP